MRRIVLLILGLAGAVALAIWVLELVNEAPVVEIAPAPGPNRPWGSMDEWSRRPDIGGFAL